MAYGQNDHAYAYAHKTNDLLKSIQENINLKGDVDVNGYPIWIDGNGCGLTRQVIADIHNGPKNEYTENERYWINANARNLRSSPSISGKIKDIYYAMFDSVIHEYYPNMNRFEK